MTPERIDDISGIYMPFWLFDMAGQGRFTLIVRGCRIIPAEYNVTATKHYKVWRKVDLDYDCIPVDASERMRDDLMDKLEPFTMKI